MDFLLIAFLTLLNGLFAMSELALASSRKARLAAMSESGDKGATAALKLLENPTQFLSSRAGRDHVDRHAQRHRGRGGFQRRSARTGCTAWAWPIAPPASWPPPRSSP
jgi:hypothetical protein